MLVSQFIPVSTITLTKLLVFINRFPRWSSVCECAKRSAKIWQWIVYIKWLPYCLLHVRMQSPMRYKRKNHVNYRQDETKPSIALALSILIPGSIWKMETTEREREKYDKDVEMPKLMAWHDNNIPMKEKHRPRIEKLFAVKIMAIWTHDLFITVQCDAIDCSTRNLLSSLQCFFSFAFSFLQFYFNVLHLHIVRCCLVDYHEKSLLNEQTIRCLSSVRCKKCKRKTQKYVRIPSFIQL